MCAEPQHRVHGFPQPLLEELLGWILCHAQLCRAMPSCAVPCHTVSP